MYYKLGCAFTDNSRVSFREGAGGRRGGGGGGGLWLGYAKNLNYKSFNDNKW